MNYHRLSSHQILPSGQDSTGSQSPEGTPTAHTTILVMQTVTGKHAVKFQVTLTDISKQVYCFWNENRQVQTGEKTPKALTGKLTARAKLLLRNTTKLSGLIRASAEASSCQRLFGSSQWLLVWRSSSLSRGGGGGRCWEEGTDCRYKVRALWDRKKMINSHTSDQEHQERHKSSHPLSLTCHAMQYEAVTQSSTQAVFLQYTMQYTM